MLFRSFRQDEDYLFFGREEQSIELLQRLGGNRFVAVVGASGSGKSSLVRCGLLSELLGGKMREAGACEVALSSPRRFALMRELGEAPEMSLAEILARVGRCDLVLIEGFKRDDFPKIEVRREGARSRTPLYGEVPGVVAIASDRPETETETIPVFQIDDAVAMADFIADHLGLEQP